MSPSKTKTKETHQECRKFARLRLLQATKGKALPERYSADKRLFLDNRILFSFTYSYTSMKAKQKLTSFAN